MKTHAEPFAAASNRCFHGKISVVGKLYVYPGVGFSVDVS